MRHSDSVSAKEDIVGQRRVSAKPRQGNRTALYLRVSTADQKPDLQDDGLRRYAARAGLEIVGDYCDVAVSGRREGRPRLNALMAAARNREIDCVLVWKFDRFAWSTRHLLSALEEFDHLGVRFVSGIEPPLRPSRGLDPVQRTDVSTRLRNAVGLGDVTDIHALAEQLLRGSPDEAAVGERINRLVMEFDFAGLTDLADSLTA